MTIHNMNSDVIDIHVIMIIGQRFDPLINDCARVCWLLLLITLHEQN